jgi:hypothetical protein
MISRRGLLAAPALLAENRKPGTLDWLLTNMRTDSGLGRRSKVIEGYCRQQSVMAGDTLEICVSTDPARQFTIDIYRMGYYGGAGGRLFRTLGPFKGRPQPEPPVGVNRVRECSWEPATSFVVPSDWPTGVYVGKLASIPEGKIEHAWHSYIIFIVRDRRRAAILYQASDNTWAAYNRWPEDYSFYTDPRGNYSFDVAVSFDRPYTKNPHTFEHPLTLGAGHFFLWEFPLVYWLEQHGYDVSYVSNSDMLDPRQWARSKVFISSGHDEYWDLRQYDNALASVKNGLTHLYLTGNAVFGVTPFSPSTDGRPNRILTRRGLYGGMFETFSEEIKDRPPVVGPPANKLIGAHTRFPPNGCGDWICTKSGHWIFAGTGMKNGDRIPGLVGHEFHGDPADIPGLEIVAEGDVLNRTKNEVRRPVHWTSTIYPGPKKNFVFNASTVMWSQGLSTPPGHVLQLYHGVRGRGPDRRVQRITHNLLRKALS